jgi:phenylacetate-CoA ligase
VAEGFPNRGAIAVHQWAQLQTLLSGVIPANRFYARKLTATVGTTPRSLRDFTERCPFTTKQELVDDQTASPPFGTNLTYPLERYTRFHQTSGTTGRPLRWLDTPQSWDRLTEDWTTVFRAAGVHAADRVLFAFTFGPFIGFWMAFEAAVRLGCLCLPGGGLTSTARLQMILETEVSVLCCTPTYAARLAEVAAEEHLDLSRSRVRVLVVAGEPGGSLPAVRERLQQLWPGARVFDHHGMTEVGPVTYECPAQPGVLHVLEGSYLAEVIEPETGRPAASGQAGELVLTTLHRLGMPLIRYRTGDLVKPGFLPFDLNPGPCACGRSELTLLGGILGRVDDMLIVRGVNLFPSAVDEILSRFSGIAEYQVVVGTAHHLTELQLRVELRPDAADPFGMMRRLEKAFQDAFALRVKIQVLPAHALPRYEMKAQRWLRSGQENTRCP